MSITAADIKILASERMTDTADGGGGMTGVAVVDGSMNSLFPNISDIDRATGRLALREVFPAVLSAGADALLGAHVILIDMPDDANVTAFAFPAAGTRESRESASARLEMSHWQNLYQLSGGVLPPMTWTSATQIQGSAASPIDVGSVVYTYQEGSGNTFPVLIKTAVSAGPNLWDVTYEGNRGTPAAAAGNAVLGSPSPYSPRLSTTLLVTNTLSLGVTYADVGSLLIPVVPVQPGAEPGSAGTIGIDPAQVIPAGLAVGFRSGDIAVVHHTAETAPAVATVGGGGGTVNCGRTNLSAVRVLGNDNAPIASGWTADLAAGIVTWTNVSGFSQPVRVVHIIEEIIGVSHTGYPEARGGAPVVGGNSTNAGPFTLSNDLTMYCGKPNVGQIKVYSKDGQDISGTSYNIYGISSPNFSYDLSAGTVTYHGNSSAFITSHSPVTLKASGTSGSVSGVTPARTPLNRITFNRPLARAFPAGTLISSAIVLGDLAAAVTDSYSQATWTDVWSDALIGTSPVAQYQQNTHPIVVANNGAITERWALIFTNSTAFRIVGQESGQVGVGTINEVCAPDNDATGYPYFTIAKEGWGGGWAAGNVLRFNTVGANAPIWVARCVLPSAPNATSDSLMLSVRGDINA